MSKDTDDTLGCSIHEDASYCGGPSMAECFPGFYVPEGEPCPESNPCEEAGTCDHTDPVPGTYCEPSQRSARGYCPDEEGHREEVCQLYEDAGEHHSLCVEDGACREVASSCGNPAHDINEQVTTAPEPSQAETLPHTGTPDVLAGVALSMIALGTGILRLVRNPA